MTPGLPKAVVKIVAERNERIADVPINALYIAFFLSIAVSLPVIVVGFYSNLLNLLGITQYELIFGYIIAFLLTIYTVAQSFKLALYKIRFVVIADIIYWSVALIFFVVFRNLTLGLVGVCVGSLLGSLVLIHEVPLGFPRVSIARMRSPAPLTVYLGAESVLGISAQQISILYLNVIAAAYAVGVFGALPVEYFPDCAARNRPFYGTIKSLLLSRLRFAARVGRYLVYFGVPICLAGFLLSYVSDVVFLRIFRVQEIRPLLLVLAAYSGLLFTTESGTNWSLRVRAQRSLAGG